MDSQLEQHKQVSSTTSEEIEEESDRNNQLITSTVQPDNEFQVFSNGNQASYVHLVNTTGIYETQREKPHSNANSGPHVSPSLLNKNEVYNVTTSHIFKPNSRPNSPIPDVKSIDTSIAKAPISNDVISNLVCNQSTELMKSVLIKNVSVSSSIKKKETKSDELIVTRPHVSENVYTTIHESKMTLSPADQVVISKVNTNDYFKETDFATAKSTPALSHDFIVSHSSTKKTFQNDDSKSETSKKCSEISVSKPVNSPILSVGKNALLQSPAINTTVSTNSSIITSTAPERNKVSVSSNTSISDIKSKKYYVFPAKKIFYDKTIKLLGSEKKKDNQIRNQRQSLTKYFTENVQHAEGSLVPSEKELTERELGSPNSSQSVSTATLKFSLPDSTAVVSTKPEKIEEDGISDISHESINSETEIPVVITQEESQQKSITSSSQATGSVLKYKSSKSEQLTKSSIEKKSSENIKPSSLPKSNIATLPKLTPIAPKSFQNHGNVPQQKVKKQKNRDVFKMPKYKVLHPKKIKPLPNKNKSPLSSQPITLGNFMSPQSVCTFTKTSPVIPTNEKLLTTISSETANQTTFTDSLKSNVVTIAKTILPASQLNSINLNTLPGKSTEVNILGSNKVLFLDQMQLEKANKIKNIPMLIKPDEKHKRHIPLHLSGSPNAATSPVFQNSPLASFQNGQILRIVPVNPPETVANAQKIYMYNLVKKGEYSPIYLLNSPGQTATPNTSPVTTNVQSFIGKSKSPIASPGNISSPTPVSASSPINIMNAQQLNEAYKLVAPKSDQSNLTLIVPVSVVSTATTSQSTVSTPSDVRSPIATASQISRSSFSVTQIQMTSQTTMASQSQSKLKITDPKINNVVVATFGNSVIGTWTKSIISTSECAPLIHASNVSESPECSNISTNTPITIQKLIDPKVNNVVVATFGNSVIGSLTKSIISTSGCAPNVSTTQTSIQQLITEYSVKKPITTNKVSQQILSDVTLVSHATNHIPNSVPPVLSRAPTTFAPVLFKAPTTQAKKTNFNASFEQNQALGLVSSILSQNKSNQSSSKVAPSKVRVSSSRNEEYTDPHDQFLQFLQNKNIPKSVRNDLMTRYISQAQETMKENTVYSLKPESIVTSESTSSSISQENGKDKIETNKRRVTHESLKTVIEKEEEITWKNATLSHKLKFPIRYVGASRANGLKPYRRMHPYKIRVALSQTLNASRPTEVESTPTVSKENSLPMILDYKSLAKSDNTSVNSVDTTLISKNNDQVINNAAVLQKQNAAQKTIENLTSNFTRVVKARPEESRCFVAVVDKKQNNATRVVDETHKDIVSVVNNTHDYAIRLPDNTSNEVSSSISNSATKVLNNTSNNVAVIANNTLEDRVRVVNNTPNDSVKNVVSTLGNGPLPPLIDTSGSLIFTNVTTAELTVTSSITCDSSKSVNTIQAPIATSIVTNSIQEKSINTIQLSETIKLNLPLYPMKPVTLSHANNKPQVLTATKSVDISNSSTKIEKIINTNVYQFTTKSELSNVYTMTKSLASNITPQVQRSTNKHTIDKSPKPIAPRAVNTVQPYMSTQVFKITQPLTATKAVDSLLRSGDNLSTRQPKFVAKITKSNALNVSHPLLPKMNKGEFIDLTQCHQINSSNKKFDVPKSRDTVGIVRLDVNDTPKVVEENKTKEKVIRGTSMNLRSSRNSISDISRTSLALERLYKTRKSWISDSFHVHKYVTSLQDLHSFLIFERRKQKVFLEEMLKKLKVKESFVSKPLSVNTYTTPAERLMEKFCIKRPTHRSPTVSPQTHSPNIPSTKNNTPKPVQNPTNQVPLKKSFKEILEEQRRKKLEKEKLIVKEKVVFPKLPKKYETIAILNNSKKIDEVKKTIKVEPNTDEISKTIEVEPITPFHDTRGSRRLVANTASAKTHEGNVKSSTKQNDVASHSNSDCNEQLDVSKSLELPRRRSVLNRFNPKDPFVAEERAIQQAIALSLRTAKKEKLKAEKTKEAISNKVTLNPKTSERVDSKVNEQENIKKELSQMNEKRDIKMTEKLDLEVSQHNTRSKRRNSSPISFQSVKKKRSIEIEALTDTHLNASGRTTSPVSFQSQKKKRTTEIDILTDTIWNESGIRADTRSPTEILSRGGETREQRKLHYAIARIAEMEHKKREQLSEETNTKKVKIASLDKANNCAASSSKEESARKQMSVTSNNTTRKNTAKNKNITTGQKISATNAAQKILKRSKRNTISRFSTLSMQKKNEARKAAMKQRLSKRNLGKPKNTSNIHQTRSGNLRAGMKERSNQSLEEKNKKNTSYKNTCTKNINIADKSNKDKSNKKSNQLSSKSNKKEYSPVATRKLARSPVPTHKFARSPVPSHKEFKDVATLPLHETKRKRHSTTLTNRECMKQDSEKVGSNKVGDNTKDTAGKHESAGKRKEMENEEILHNENLKMKHLSVSRSTGETILHKAARKGYLDVAEDCIGKGANVNAKDNAGWTPIHEACAYGNRDVVELLLKYGADPNAVSNSGIRPLHDASEKGFINIIRLLLAYGADHTISTYAGYVPMNNAADEVIRTFLTEFDISNPDDNGIIREKIPWRFEGSCGALDRIDCSGIFDNIPSCDLPRDFIEIDMSTKDMINSFYLPYRDEKGVILGYRNYYLLEDVLKRLSCSRSAFLHHHPKIEIREMKWSVFEREARQSVLNIIPSQPSCGSKNKDPKVEIVYLGRHLYRKIFNLRTKRLPFSCK